MSDGDDHRAPGVSRCDVADRLGRFDQLIGPVDDGRHLAGFDESLEGDQIDLAAYVVEHLALELDPFPRKPGAEFDYQPEAAEVSPFAVLKKLTDPKA